MISSKFKVGDIIIHKSHICQIKEITKFGDYMVGPELLTYYNWYVEKYFRLATEEEIQEFILQTI